MCSYVCAWKTRQILRHIDLADTKHFSPERVLPNAYFACVSGTCACRTCTCRMASIAVLVLTKMCPPPRSVSRTCACGACTNWGTGFNICVCDATLCGVM